MHKSSQPASEPKVKWEWQSNANPWSSSELQQWTPYDQSYSDLLENAYKNKEEMVNLGDYLVFINKNNSRQVRKDDPSKERRVRRIEEPLNLVQELKSKKVIIQWEWQSNTNPWSSTEELEWTPYKVEENQILEEAYQEGIKSIDLGEFLVIISGKDMTQHRKNDVFRKRRVRRREFLEEDSTEVNIIPKKFYGVEKPKTYNKAFGSLQDFLTFFENRGPEISQFAELFKEMEKSFDSNKFNKIIPILINSIQKEAKKNYRYAESVLKLFQNKEFQSIEEFLKIVLKTYTMETFLYFNLNKYLRNEDWEGLTCLLPYAYCLYKAFLNEKFILDSFQRKSKDSAQTQNKMLLYRGAGLTESDLNFYNTQKAINFSWNAVTSTSTKRSVAEGFMTKKPCVPDEDPDKNIQVIFVIEVPFSSEDLKYQNWLDLKPFSVFPNEEEIALGPGSTFKLVKSSRNGNFAEIRLELITNLMILSSQGQILHGTFHAQMTKGVTSRLVCLEGEELMEALRHLIKNELIEEMELDICLFDETTLEKLKEVLPTISRLRKLSCISSSSKDNQHLNLITKAIANLGISELKIRDQVLEIKEHVIPFAQGIRNLKSLTTLNLNFMFVKIQDKDLNLLCSQGIRHLTSLTTLKINFIQSSMITDEGIQYLCSEGLRHLTKLITLKLSFDGDGVFESRLKILGSEGIRYLKSLETLNLTFLDGNTVDDNINNHFLENSLIPFGDEIRNLKKLVNMKLRLIDHVFTLESFKKFLLKNIKLEDVEAEKTTFVPRCAFKRDIQNTLDNKNDIQTLSESQRKTINSLELTICDKDLFLKTISQENVSGQGKNHVCQRKKYLNSLTDLNLVFEQCENIHEEGLNHFCKEIFQHLTSLTSLSIIFKRCEIKGGVFKTLASQAIMKLTKLESLKINFWQSKFNDEELDHLCTYGLKNLTQLRDLKLNFSCNLTNEGLRVLTAKGISELKSLTNLSLNLCFSDKLTEQGLNHLCSIGIKNLTALTSLSLTIGFYKFTEEGCRIIGSQALKNLTSLTSLSLNFGNEVKDDGLKQFCLHTIKYLTSLTYLSLSFTACSITDEGLKILASQGIRELQVLTNLTLNFNRCVITDEGLKILASQGIKHLTVINDISLGFSKCQTITEEGLVYLYSQGIKSLTSLKNLSLKFEDCGKILNKGLSHLSSGLLKNLITLTSLRLSFIDCSIGNDGLTHLCSQGIKYLGSLTSLDLSFEYCNITDKGLKIIGSEGIKNLTSLTHLSVKINEMADITNEGLKDLCYGIKGLVSLKGLSLNFDNCNISDEGLNYLCSHALKKLTLLTSLDLNFDKCKITDQGLSFLCDNGIKNLTSLITLSLKFQEYENNSNLTGWGLNYLCFHGVKHLKLLTELKLDFDGIKISKKSFKSFHKILNYFGLHLSDGAASTVYSTLPDPII